SPVLRGRYQRGIDFTLPRDHAVVQPARKWFMSRIAQPIAHKAVHGIGGSGGIEIAPDEQLQSDFAGAGTSGHGGIRRPNYAPDRILRIRFVVRWPSRRNPIGVVIFGLPVRVRTRQDAPLRQGATDAPDSASPLIRRRVTRRARS